MIFYGKTFAEKQLEDKGSRYDDDLRKAKEEISRLKAELAAAVRKADELTNALIRWEQAKP
jgi:hypothetical protein